MKIPFEWEALVSGETFRAKVFGGWIITDGDGGKAIGMAFIPDPKHEWEISEE